MKTLIAFIIGAFMCQGISSQVTGKWKTIDDETGEEKSIVEIYQKNGKVYGKIVEILNPDKKDALCDLCEGADHNKPINGMVIIKDLEKDDDEYEDGTIFDPSTGKLYRAKIWVDGDNNNLLNVRGYIAFFFKTQQWIRVKS